MRKAIWDSFLDADMNVRYWAHLSRIYHIRNMWVKIFVSITASGTVLSWLFISNNPCLWKTLSTIAALVAIVQLFLGWEGCLEKMYSLEKEWVQIKNDYELLWIALRNKKKSASELEENYKQLKVRETNLLYIGHGLPTNKGKLIRKCQMEVLSSRGLQK
ncbi:MAG: hypothetical protein KJ842_01405 [Candidatus Omnitrophica bacterium]|nr:hypothetical protein [Candidatus Omnitrophota bacterium]